MVNTPVLSVEEMADFLWSEGFDLPHYNPRYPYRWRLFVKRKYAEVNSGAEQWERLLQQSSYDITERNLRSTKRRAVRLREQHLQAAA